MKLNMLNALSVPGNSKIGTFPSLIVVLLLIYNSQLLPTNSSITNRCRSVKREICWVLLLISSFPWRVPELTVILVIMINRHLVKPESATKVLPSIMLAPDVDEMRI